MASETPIRRRSSPKAFSETTSSKTFIETQGIATAMPFFVEKNYCWVMNYHHLLCKTPHWTTVKKGTRRQRGVHEVNHFLKALCRKYRSFTSKYDEVRDEKTKKRRSEETKIRSDEETKLQVVEQKIPRRFGRGIFS